MPLTRPEEKTALQRYLPIVDWFPQYNWKNVRWSVPRFCFAWAVAVRREPSVSCAFSALRYSSYRRRLVLGRSDMDRS